MNNIIGFDLDGVVFKPQVSFYGLIKGINFNFLMSKLKREDVFKEFFHRGIEINNQIKKLLKGLKKNGYKTVAISGHSVDYKAEVADCLKINKIFFNDLHLCPGGNSHKKFKLEKIKETNCVFYIEDKWDIVSFLRKKLGNDCYVIHYREGHSIVNELNILFNI